MRGWTMGHIEKLQTRGLVLTDLAIVNTDKPKKYSQKELRNIPKEEPRPLTEMKQTLKFMQVTYVTEYKFSDDRKFRFDIAIPEKKIAIEYEGLFSDKSRHTSVTGFTMDTEKYNLAIIEGWRVLRYTPMNYKHFFADLNKIL